MLENQGSLATGKAGAGPTEMADVLSGEWQVKGREAGKMCQELEVGINVMLFRSADIGFWRDLLNHTLSSVTFPRHAVVPKFVTTRQ